MALVGLLHRNVTDARVDHEVYFAASGTPKELRELHLYYEQIKDVTCAKRVMLNDCSFSNDRTTLSHKGNELYIGSEPFVIAEVSDQELGYIFNPKRCDDHGFMNDVLIRSTFMRKLLYDLYRNDSMSEEQKDNLTAELFEKGTFSGKDIRTLTYDEVTQERIPKRERRMREIFQEGFGKSRLEEHCSSECLEEISIIGDLMFLKKHKHLSALNERHYPDKIIDMICLKT